MTLTLTDEMRDALAEGPVEFLDERTGRRFRLVDALEPATASDRKLVLQGVAEADAGLARPWTAEDMKRGGRRLVAGAGEQVK